MPVVTKFFRNENDTTPLEFEMFGYMKDNDIRVDDIKKIYYNTCYDPDRKSLVNTVMLVYYRNMTGQEYREWRENHGMGEKEKEDR